MLKKFKELRKNKKGFTLIELVVVLVIIAILAAITVPVVTGYIEDANNARYISEAQAIYMVIQTEEAKVLAKDGALPDTDAGLATFYDGVETTAVGKLNGSITGIGISKAADGKYTVTFTSDKAKVATIDPNNEITIANP